MQPTTLFGRLAARFAQLLIGLGILASACFAQDRIIANSGPYFTLTRNASPGSSGGTGLNNNYIVNPSPAYQGGFCFQAINKHAVNQAVFTVTVFQSSDSAITTFTGNTLNWLQSTAFVVTVNNLASTSFFIPISGGAKYTFQVTGASTAGGPVDLVVQQTTGGCAPSAGSPGALWPNGTVASVPYDCSNSTRLSVATGTTAKLVNATGAGTALFAIHVCAYSITVNGAATASLGSFVSGTGATCATNQTTQWAVKTGTTNGQVAALASSKQLFATKIGEDLCFTDSGSTTGTEVDISYAVF